MLAVLKSGAFYVTAKSKVPEFFVKVNIIPLTRRGKVDYRSAARCNEDPL